jgi:cysteine/glycine-rich protein
MNKLGGTSSTCVRCQKGVYYQEQAIGPGGFYHKVCLTCTSCNKRLDSTNITDKNSEAYCKTCYGRLFGPKGHGLGLSTESKITAVVSNTSLERGKEMKSNQSLEPKPERNSNPKLFDAPSNGPNQNECASCKKVVYHAEQVIGPGGIKYHKSCFKCSECSRFLDSRNLTDSKNVLFCKGCHGKNFGPKGYGYGNLLTPEGPK